MLASANKPRTKIHQSGLIFVSSTTRIAWWTIPYPSRLKNIGWFSLNNVRKKIRPTNIEKIKAIENVHQIVINNNLDKEEFILYKSPKFKEIISNDDIDDDIVVI